MFAAEKARLVRHRQHLRLEAVYLDLAAAPGQVGAPDRSLEGHVAAEGRPEELAFRPVLVSEGVGTYLEECDGTLARLTLTAYQEIRSRFRLKTRVVRESGRTG